MNYLLKFNKFVAFLCIIVLLTGCAAIKKKKAGPDAPLTEIQVAQQRAAGKKVIAMMPLQKAFSAPLYLSRHPGLFTSLKQMMEEKRVKLGKKIDYDPALVERELARIISDKVIENGYLVFLPHQVEPYLRQMAYLDSKEFPLERLNEYLKADGYLTLTITEWDAEDYDQDGKVKVSFQAILIDVKTKEAVWTNEAKDLTLEPPSNSFLYSKYQDEIIQALARRILKGLPKNEWT